MAPRPYAKGYCDDCGSFLVWDKENIYVLMHQRPNSPEVVAKCSECQKEIRNIIDFKAVTSFHKRGVTVRHSYDDGNDIQPLTEEDVKYLERNLDYILAMIMEG